MNYADIMAAALRQPQPQTRGMQASVMSKPSQPDPVLNEDLPLESVSPEDWVPNPKSVAAMLAKGGAGVGLAGITSGDAWKEGLKYAQKLRGKEYEALRQYATPDEPMHAFRINAALRRGEVLKPEQIDFLQTMAKILRGAPKADTEFPMYRGLPIKNRYDRDPGFMSLTAQKDSAQSYGENIEDDLGNLVGTSVKLYAPKGAPLVNPDVKQWWDDAELVMPRGSQITPYQKLILPEDFR